VESSEENAPIELGRIVLMQLIEELGKYFRLTMERAGWVLCGFHFME